jgi:N-acyl-D-aspartate/D-glutamate deacylase
VAHGPVRVYVMGERGAKNEPATAEDIEKMAAIVQEGIEAGALGFSTSRTIVHRAIDGEPVPGTFAAEDEVFGIGRGMQRAGAGIFELAPAGTIGKVSLDPGLRNVRPALTECTVKAVLSSPPGVSILTRPIPDTWSTGHYSGRESEFIGTRAP